MDNRSVDLNLLVVLDALLAERSVTKASQRLHLSQSATIAALSRLRQVFDDPLLLRTAGGMLPTSRGTELELPVRSLLGDIERMVLAGHEFHPHTTAATFTISASDYVEYTILPRLIDFLEANSPSSRLAVRPMDFEAIGRQLESGETGIALMSTANAPPDVRSRPLYSERFVLIARRDHPTVGHYIDIDTYCSLDHVMVSPRGGGFTGAIDGALAQAGQKRRVKLSVPHYLLVPEVVVRTNMIAALPERLALAYADRVHSIEPPFPIREFTIALVWHERTHRDPAQR
ncbi:MAG: LysR family transcriptional regulator [Betaproteobacteria bacterium]|nr:LysR family transcriptional regulator [Betaproteobacteria bacterium]